MNHCDCKGREKNGHKKETKQSFLAHYLKATFVLHILTLINTKTGFDRVFMLIFVIENNF